MPSNQDFETLRTITMETSRQLQEWDYNGQWATRTAEEWQEVADELERCQRIAQAEASRLWTVEG